MPTRRRSISWVLLLLAACEPSTPDDLAAGDVALSATGMLPAFDVAAIKVVGAPDAASPYRNVDEATADDATSYVRGQAGVGVSSHTVGYSGGPSGTVSSVSVHYRAHAGTGAGTVQVNLLEGDRLVGAGKVNAAMPVWTSYSETFGALGVASASTLRTQVVLTNTKGQGALRYTQVWIDPVVGTAPPPPPSESVDPSTMHGKLLMGYQGWFFCPGDGSAINRWVHWFFSNGAPHEDYWPDTRELPASEKCVTPLTFPGGQPAPVYSAFREPTVVRHFQWMKDHHLDGVMLQRFSSELKDPAFFAARNQVTRNVRVGAETHGRTFSIMYDISGQDPSTLVATLENDWKYLVDVLQVTQSPRYQRHAGKPVLTIWGFGFADRPATVAMAEALLTFFKNNPDPRYQVTLMAGVPRGWRALAPWLPTFRKFDVLSPWTVGSYVDDAGADNYRGTLQADLADAQANHFEVMPVVFPGFSWHNLNGGPLNQIPRRGGKFYWRQVYNAVQLGAPMVFGAMFDEVDEGTAMMKVAPTAALVPTQAPFLSLDVDGYGLPSDWYLQVADEAGKMLRKQSPLTPVLPLIP